MLTCEPMCTNAFCTHKQKTHLYNITSLGAKKAEVCCHRESQLLKVEITSTSDLVIAHSTKYKIGFKG